MEFALCHVARSTLKRVWSILTHMPDFVATTRELHGWKTKGGRRWLCPSVAFSLMYLCVFMETAFQGALFVAAQEQKASSTASGTALKSVLHAAADLQPAVTINSGIELYKVLSTPLTHDLAVIFQDNVNLSDGVWNNAKPIVVPENRILLLQAPLKYLPDFSSSLQALYEAGGKNFSFSGRSGIFDIETNGTLVLSGIHLTGVAFPQQQGQQPQDQNASQLFPDGLVGYPSILCYRNCQVIYNFTVGDFYGVSNDCSETTLNDIAFQASIVVRNPSLVGVVPGSTAVYVMGNGAFDVPIVNSSNPTQTVSDASTYVNRTILNCLQSVPVNALGNGSGQPSHIPAWGWVLIGLAIGLVLCVIILAAVVKQTIFFKRKKESRTSGLHHWPASVPVLASEGNRSSLDHEDPSHKSVQLVAFGQLRDAWRSRIGEVHGLDFTETIGRGGFANVYKAVWRGTIVAVKLIEHSIDGATTKNIQREAALSTSVSHPNIVITYKVATVGIADLEQMLHYIEVSKDMPSTSTSNPGQHSSSVGSKIESSSLELDQIDSIILSQSQSGNDEDGSHCDSDIDSELVATLIIMEYCDLGSAHEALFNLHVFILPDGWRDLVSMLRLLIDVALGLDYLHTVANIVHGDLKPSNILIKSSGSTKRGWVAKLGDFGIAKAMDTGSIQQSMAAARLGGTHGYLSPEIMSGRSAGQESDVYAFGILMWVLCTALPPFRDVGLGQLAYEVVMLNLRPSLHESGIDMMPLRYIDLMKSCWNANAPDRPKFDTIVTELRGLLGEVINNNTLLTPEAGDHRFLSVLRSARVL